MLTVKPDEFKIIPNMRSLFAIDECDDGEFVTREDPTRNSDLSSTPEKGGLNHHNAKPFPILGTGAGGDNPVTRDPTLAQQG